MSHEPNARRVFLTGSAALALSLLGCGKKPLECSGEAELPESARNARKSAGYIDRSPDLKRACKECQQWEALGTDRCGSCKLLRGPIHPAGTCRLFARAN